MKASEALSMVAGLVAMFGREAVEAELDRIDGTVKPSALAMATEKVVRDVGDTVEVQAILSALPHTAAATKTHTRRSAADVALLRSKVLDRVKELGSEVSASELAVQLSEETRAVSYALGKLTDEGQIKMTGDKRTARYSAV